MLIAWLAELQLLLRAVLAAVMGCVRSLPPAAGNVAALCSILADSATRRLMRVLRDGSHTASLCLYLRSKSLKPCVLRCELNFGPPLLLVLHALPAACAEGLSEAACAVLLRMAASPS